MCYNMYFHFSINFFSLFSLLVYVSEFSPYLYENYILDFLPFLKLKYGKPILYIM